MLGGDHYAREVGAFLQDELHRGRLHRALIQGERRQSTHSRRDGLWVQ